MGRKYNGEKDKKSKEWADIPGEQIRKQYFNVPMYIFAGAAYFFICCGIFLPIGGGEWSSALAFAVGGC